MPVYEYKGLNAKGKNIQGVKEAESPRSLKAALRKEGIFLTELYEEKAGKAEKKKLAGKKNSGGVLSIEVDFKKYFQRVSAQEVTMFTRQLATLNRAGIPLVEALSALVDQTENDKFKRVLSQLKDKVNEGEAFADALKSHPKIFSDLYINMIRAGEASGALDIVLERLAEFTEAQLKLRRKITGALVYPAVMTIFGVIIVFVLMALVVPRVTKLFEDINATLPINTRILIAVSDAMSTYWFIFFPALGLAIYGIRRYINSETGRAKYDALLLKVPIFGRLVRMIATSRFSSTMSTLLMSGVPMLAALDIVKSIVGNKVLVGVLDDARTSVREGESLALPLRRSGEFDPIVGHMVAVGERAGQLEEMLKHVSDAYETQVEARVNQLTSLLEPLIMVAMGAIVGFVVMSILLPILQLNSAIKS